MVDVVVYDGLRGKGKGSRAQVRFPQCANIFLDFFSEHDTSFGILVSDVFAV